MDPVTLILTAVNGLRLVLANPALGGGSSVRLDQASELLGILGTLIAEGDDALDDLRAFAETIQSMVDQGRGPTPDEWDVLRARSDDAHARLQAVKEELLGQEEETPTPEPTPAPEENATEGEGEGEDPVAPV